MSLSRNVSLPNSDLKYIGLYVSSDVALEAAALPRGSVDSWGSFLSVLVSLSLVIFCLGLGSVSKFPIWSTRVELEVHELVTFQRFVCAFIALGTQLLYATDIIILRFTGCTSIVLFVFYRIFIFCQASVSICLASASAVLPQPRICLEKMYWLHHRMLLSSIVTAWDFEVLQVSYDSWIIKHTRDLIFVLSKPESS